MMASNDNLPTVGNSEPTQSQSHSRQSAKRSAEVSVDANATAAQTHTKEIKVGDRLEVQWLLGAPEEEGGAAGDAATMAEGATEQTSGSPSNTEQGSAKDEAVDVLWWPCTVIATEGMRELKDDETGDNDTYQVYKLRYDPIPERGWEESEETECIFVAFHRLLDFSYDGFLYYRHHGEDFDPAPLDKTIFGDGNAVEEGSSKVHSDWTVLTTKDGRAAAEQLVNDLMNPITQQLLQRQLAPDISYRVAEVIRDMRVKCIEAIEKHFESNRDLDSAAATKIIAELSSHYEAHLAHIKRPRVI